MIAILDKIALVAGYVVLGVSLLFGMMHASLYLTSWWAWSKASPQAKQIGASMDYDAGMAALIADGMLESLNDMDIETSTLEPEPQPLATIDWSVENTAQEEIEGMLHDIENAGYVVHQFPREKDGEWSQKYVGVWAIEPEWYLVDGDGKAKIKPDIPDTPN